MSRCTCALDTCLHFQKCSGILRSILARRLHKLPDCMWITGSWKKCASTNHAATMTVATSITVRTLKRTTQDCIHTVWQGFVRYLAPHVPSPPACSVLFSQSSRESPSGICRQGMYSLAQAEESLHASLWFSTESECGPTDDGSVCACCTTIEHERLQRFKQDASSCRSRDPFCVEMDVAPNSALSNPLRRCRRYTHPFPPFLVEKDAARVSCMASVTAGEIMCWKT